MARKIKVEDIPTGKPNEFLRCNVSYHEGGISFATYERIERGYYGSIGPVTLKDGFESFVAFSRCSFFIEPATRFNAKRLQVLASTIKDDARYKDLLAKMRAAVGATVEV